MAIFMETGGGDIYAGPTREDVIAAMQEDLGDDFELSEVSEVAPSRKISVTDENDEPTGELITLEEEYDASIGTYCIASTNY